MKNIILTSIAIIFNFSIYAQYPTMPLESKVPFEVQPDAYYKDTGNVLNQFEGTWLYTNGTTSLKIVLVKQPQVFDSNYGGFYEDLIIGEYQYIENGVEKINTLSNIGLNLRYEHKIYGNSIYRDCNYMTWDDCTEGEARLMLGLTDANPEKSHYAIMAIKKRRINGLHALKVFISFKYVGTYQENVPTPSPTLPWQQEYIMFKQ